MKVEEIAKWCIDNRFNALSNSNFEMYTSIVDMIETCAKDQIKKDRERVLEQIYEDDGAELILTSFKNTPIILD